MTRLRTTSIWQGLHRLHRSSIFSSVLSPFRVDFLQVSGRHHMWSRPQNQPRLELWSPFFVYVLNVELTQLNGPFEEPSRGVRLLENLLQELVSQHSNRMRLKVMAKFLAAIRKASVSFSISSTWSRLPLRLCWHNILIFVFCPLLG